MNVFKSSALAAAILGLSTYDSAVANERQSSFNFVIEIAGADTTDAATEDELKRSGTPIVPAQPSAESRDPLANPPQSPASTTNEQIDEEPVVRSDDGENRETPNASTIKTTEESNQPHQDIVAPVDTPYYTRVDIGAFVTNDPDGAGRNGTNQSTELDGGLTFSAGIGMLLEENIRGDITISYRDTIDITGTDGAGNSVGGDVDSYGAMVNLYYDFTEVHGLIGSDLITPYVGAGLGVSYLGASDLATTGGATERDAYSVDLAYAAMAGVSTAIGNGVALDLGYRFINLGQFEHDGTFSDGSVGKATEYDDLITHEFRAGLRIDF